MVLEQSNRSGKVPNLRQRDVRETSNIGLSPNITDFTNSQHNHSNSAQGGNVTGSHTNLTDIGTHTHAEIDSHLDGTDQTEIRAILEFANSPNWETLYTVTAGKTLFITDIFCGNNDPTTETFFELGLSSTAILHIDLSRTSGGTGSFWYSFNTPIKYTTEQVVQAKSSNDTDVNFITILGYEK